MTHNFNAGPAALPREVLERVQTELLDTHGTGMSLLEWSHRSSAFESVRAHAENGLRNLLDLNDEWAVLFLQGGASLQFSMVPMNLLRDYGESQYFECADYLIHGSWGRKAFGEANKSYIVHPAASTQSADWKRVPRPDEIELDSNARYVHLTTNETIEGTQWHQIPDCGTGKIVADMSSDILSRPLEVEKYGLIYAGAQKNIGPSGVTVVAIRRAWIEENSQLPTMLSYATHAQNDSLYNTPNTFGIWMIALVCEWIEERGGLSGMQKRAEDKAAQLYDVIDASDFYAGFAELGSRSQMNITFRLLSEELEKQFAREAEQHGFVGLKGHRSVGGLRASIYNAVPPESVAALADFMREFERKNG